jgi:peptidoglycan/LPS O-acetylase OafA/YrhL
VIASVSALGIISLMPGDVIHALTFSSNFDHTRSWFVGHLWSLSVEEQFYLLWPVIFVWLRRRAIWVAGAAVLVAPVSRTVMHLWFPEWRWAISESFPTVMDALATGCVLAMSHDRLARSPLYLRRVRSPFVWLAPLFIVAVNSYASHIAMSYTVGYTVQNFAIALMLHRLVISPATAAGRVLNHRSVAYVGLLSYSLYMWQQPFLNRTSSLAIAAFPVNVLLAFAAAMLSYHLVEQPALACRRALVRRHLRDAMPDPNSTSVRRSEISSRTA